jgi:hypothetical protein
MFGGFSTHKSRHPGLPEAIFGGPNCDGSSHGIQGRASWVPCPMHGSRPEMIDYEVSFFRLNQAIGIGIEPTREVISPSKDVYVTNKKRQMGVEPNIHWLISMFFIEMAKTNPYHQLKPKRMRG